MLAPVLVRAPLEQREPRAPPDPRHARARAGEGERAGALVGDGGQEGGRLDAEGERHRVVADPREDVDGQLRPARGRRDRREVPRREPEPRRGRGRHLEPRGPGDARERVRDLAQPGQVGVARVGAQRGRKGHEVERGVRGRSGRCHEEGRRGAGPQPRRRRRRRSCVQEPPRCERGAEVGPRHGRCAAGSGPVRALGEAGGDDVVRVRRRERRRRREARADLDEHLHRRPGVMERHHHRLHEVHHPRPRRRRRRTTRARGDRGGRAGRARSSGRAAGRSATTSGTFASAGAGAERGGEERDGIDAVDEEHVHPAAGAVAQQRLHVREPRRGVLARVEAVPDGAPEVPERRVEEQRQRREPGRVRALALRARREDRGRAARRELAREPLDLGPRHPRALREGGRRMGREPRPERPRLRGEVRDAARGIDEDAEEPERDSHLAAAARAEPAVRRDAGEREPRSDPGEPRPRVSPADAPVGELPRELHRRAPGLEEVRAERDHRPRAREVEDRQLGASEERLARGAQRRGVERLEHDAVAAAARRRRPGRRAAPRPSPRARGGSASGRARPPSRRPRRSPSRAPPRPRPRAAARARRPRRGAADP